MTTISIVNQKGGTGKTTTTVNLGSALTQMGKKILMVDMDSQGNLGYSLSLDEGYTIADVFEEKVDINEVVQSKEGIDIIPSDIRMVDIELSLIDLEDRHKLLKTYLGNLNETYDFVLIDCPPSLSVLAVNALYASDTVIIPMMLEVLSLQGLDQITQTIQKINASYDKDIQVLGILPVMVDKRRKLTEEVREYIDENYDLDIFDSMIRNNVKASEAPSFGQSVISYAPTSNSAKDYIALAGEILNTK